MLRNRSAELVSLYASIEVFVKSLGQVELVTRDRYVLMRSKKIFADLVVMSDALRLVIHLPKEMKNPLFIKVVGDRRHVSHVAKLQSLAEFDTLKPFLREAYDFSLA